MLSNRLIICPALLLLPSIFPSVKVFPNEIAVCIRWPNYRSFSFSISPSNEHPGVIFFRMDWLDLLSVQGTLKSLLQHQKHQFFTAQCFLWSSSHICTRHWEKKAIALTIQTFVSKVMSLFAIAFNILFHSFQYTVCHSFPSKESFNFMATVTVCCDFGTQENKICHCFHFFPLLFAMK